VNDGGAAHLTANEATVMNKWESLKRAAECTRLAEAGRGKADSPSEAAAPCKN
jgi:hypothetical protein